MYLLKYASTPETTNLARVARMILGPCTDVLPAVLTKEISPSALSHSVKTFIANHPKHKQCPISKEQENLIHGKIYEDFDISLLYTILRNICRIPGHKNGWGNVPLPTDRSVSANIERIRLIRNEYRHSSALSVANVQFKRKWQDILKIVEELESHLSSSTVFQNAVIDISVCSMDPEQESKYIKQLFDLDKKIQDISEETKRVENTCVPKNVRVLYERDLSSWKKDDCMFVETHNFPSLLEQVRKQTYVTFIGVPGSGKTATARHVALILQKEGYEILPIKDIKNIETYCDPHHPQVFVIDDVIGVFGLDMTELNNLKKYQDRFKEPTMSKTKTLMTCREAIFRNELVSNAHFMSHEKHLIQLSTDANALTAGDRHKLLVMYNLDMYVLPVQQMQETSKMFPMLCKLFSQKIEFRCYGPDFFRTPIPCILNAVEQMKTENRLQYVSLVLLMANQNKLSEEDLENESNCINNFNEIKCEVLKKCKVEQRTDTFKFIDALSEMEGTYTKKCGKHFTFEHDSMFEIIAYHFGCRFPELILQVMSSDYIANYIKLDTSEKGDDKCKTENYSYESIENVYTSGVQEGVFNLHIKLRESHYHPLCERLAIDMNHRGYQYVFMNKTLKHLPFLQKFIGLLGADVNMMHGNETPLIAASCCGILNIVEELIKAGADVNLSDGQETPLTAACERSHLAVIRSLITSGADVNLKDGMFTPLTIACGKGQLNVIDTLIKAGADVNMCDEYRTPLTIACENGHLTVVVLLIQSGANVNVSDGMNTPLTVACEEKESVETKRMIEYGIKFGFIEISSITQQMACEDIHKYFQSTYKRIVQFLVKNEAEVNINDGFKTPLTTACEKGRLDLVQELIKFGADVNLADKNDTPLITACYYGFLSIVNVLIKACADVNQSNENETPLIIACKRGHLSIVQTLIKAGAIVNLDKNYRTPLTSACEDGYVDLVEELIKVGANVNLSDGCYTPLTVSCERGHVSVVKKLITFGADINMKNGNNTPLSAACEHGHLHIVEELIKTGVDTNNVLLYVTSEKRLSGIVEKLKEKGAKVVLQNNIYERHQENEMFFDMNDSLLNSLTETTKKLQRFSQMFSRPLALSMRFDKKNAWNKRMIARIDKWSKTLENNVC